MKKLLVAACFLFSLQVQSGIVGVAFRLMRATVGSGAVGLVAFPSTYFFGGKYVDTLPDAKNIRWHLPTFYDSDVSKAVRILRKALYGSGINPDAVRVKLSEKLTPSVKSLSFGEVGFLNWGGQKYALINPEHLKQQGKEAFAREARIAAARMKSDEQATCLIAVPAVLAPFFLKGAMKASSGFIKRALSRNIVSLVIVVLLDIPVSEYFKQEAERKVLAREL